MPGQDELLYPTTSAASLDFPTRISVAISSGEAVSEESRHGAPGTCCEGMDRFDLDRITEGVGQIAKSHCYDYEGGHSFADVIRWNRDTLFCISVQPAVYTAAYTFFNTSADAFGCVVEI